ncbi:hypothetical protein [Natribacillus halophilus]|uniref:Uncharacterized protein n=1 Tax=Natribacillus halophilus TaxID=549003 RepID=A0A1G8SK26_9BACI|nr:hypothetical protein [Natribacillus halophilus]SDJ29596.1 hypothetical protein SAMN04488123_1307 [Natribacillus halophilus]
MKIIISAVLLLGLGSTALAFTLQSDTQSDANDYVEHQEQLMEDSDVVEFEKVEEGIYEAAGGAFEIIVDENHSVQSEDDLLTQEEFDDEIQNYIDEQERLANPDSWMTNEGTEIEYHPWGYDHEVPINK